MYCRKNQNSLNASEKAKFVAALLALKANGTYDQYVRDHEQIMQMPPPAGWPMMGGHRGPAFLPWHREFLIRLETDLRAIDSTVTLPYWDWTVDNSPLSSIWGPDLMGGNGRPGDNKVMTGPFAFDAGSWNCVDDTQYLRRRMGAGAATLPTPMDLTTALNQTPYDVVPWDESSPSGFRNTLEGWISGPQLHNRVHVWVGGSMEPATSPNDPIFFMHHCFLDKCWADWQRAHPGFGYVPVAGARAGQNVNDQLQPWLARGINVTPAGLLDHHALGYAYDNELICRKLAVKEIKREKLEKPELKERKREKLEIKERKHEKLEKIEKLEIKEQLKHEKHEKVEFEKMRPDKLPATEGKLIREGPEGPVELGGDPLHERLIQLEQAVSDLHHFINPELRPDLGEGALLHEEDLHDFPG